MIYISLDLKFALHRLFWFSDVTAEIYIKFLNTYTSIHKYIYILGADIQWQQYPRTSMECFWDSEQLQPPACC